MRVNIVATSAQKAEQINTTIKEDKILTLLKNASLSDIEKYISENITTLSAAKTLLERILVILAYLLNKVEG